MFWNPTKIWQGMDVYIIGGGPSLAKFNFDLLKDKKSIGVNTAFRKGPEICPICFFGDFDFYKHHRSALYAFDGDVVTNNPALIHSKDEWLLTMKRYPDGLHTNGLGWSGNSGAAAVNLALILGAARVLLLGFDMKLKDGKSNWHNEVIKKVYATAYDRFVTGFLSIQTALPRVFPGTEIINVTNDSNLPYFPKVRPEEIFGDNCYGN